MLAESKFAVTTSRLGSLLKYATATEFGLLTPSPRLIVLGGPKPPAPFPKSSVILFERMFAVTTSWLPSLLKSPTATEFGLSAPGPRLIVLGGPKPPAPLANTTVILL